MAEFLGGEEAELGITHGQENPVGVFALGEVDDGVGLSVDDGDGDFFLLREDLGFGFPEVGFVLAPAIARHGEGSLEEVGIVEDDAVGEEAALGVAAEVGAGGFESRLNVFRDLGHKGRAPKGEVVSSAGVVSFFAVGANEDVVFAPALGLEGFEILEAIHIGAMEENDEAGALLLLVATRDAEEVGHAFGAFKEGNLSRFRLVGRGDFGNPGLPRGKGGEESGRYEEEGEGLMHKKNELGGGISKASQLIFHPSAWGGEWLMPIDLPLVTISNERRFFIASQINLSTGARQAEGE